jgi:ubiquinone/menaquinone biosynthesis C-methylase UbiE
MPQSAVGERLKACCAELYESDWARLLLGDSLHPGGLELTERLGSLMELNQGERVLDVAAGTGTSAIFLANRFDVEVVGIDYGKESVAAASVAAVGAGLGDQVRFGQGDAERLPYDEGALDAVICECAFCTFPDKAAAAGEFFRVLRPGGRLGLSDLTRTGPLTPELDGLLAWISCIADALPKAEYVRRLEAAGFSVDLVEPHDEALQRTVGDVRTKLLTAELFTKLKRLELTGIDLAEATNLARSAAEAARDGKLGYSLLVARKPGTVTRK